VKIFWKLLSQNWIKIGNTRQLDTAFIVGFQKETETRIKLLGRKKVHNSALLAVIC